MTSGLGDIAAVAGGSVLALTAGRLLLRYLAMRLVLWVLWRGALPIAFLVAIWVMAEIRAGG
ncbi:MAG: hypothetical protein AAGI70_13605 [Pseudomonadota bacterium]